MWKSHDSPRIRRLRSDEQALRALAEQSTILKIKSTGRPAQHYQIEFLGKSLARESGRVSIRMRHRLEIKLGASYPLTVPELRWLTPIFHPNISEIGMVCLGGFGTHWVPSFRLDALITMLWDMARYFNYDIRSPYNRDAALWAAHQSTFKFPLDERPLRDLRAAVGRIENPTAPATPGPSAPEPPRPSQTFASSPTPGRPLAEPSPPSEPALGGAPGEDDVVFLTD